MLQNLFIKYKPSISKIDAYLIFRSLNKSRTGYITLEEFYEFYDAMSYSWKLSPINGAWYEGLNTKMKNSVKQAVQLSDVYRCTQQWNLNLS